jgi:hypothetical protein
MKKALFCSIFFMVALALGCAGQLAVKQMTVDPVEVAAGNKAKIVVAFDGPKNKVANVTATVRENPDVYYSLNDEGKNGDEKAGDNIWSRVAEVPWDAPAALYHLDIRATDKDGNEIFAKGSEQKAGRSGTITVTVK